MPDGGPLRLVSYNIRFGGGSRLAFIGAVLASLEPDVVLLQEATDPIAVDRIAKCGRPPARLPAAGLERGGREPRAAARARVAPARPLARLPRAVARRASRGSGSIGLHLPAGLSARGERARLRSVDSLLEWAGGAADDNTILMGDLNSVARGDVPRVAAMPLWLRLLLRFDGGIRTDVQDRLAAAGWIDAFRHLHPDDPGFTLPALEPQIRLDYALVPPRCCPR